MDKKRMQLPLFVSFDQVVMTRVISNQIIHQVRARCSALKALVTVTRRVFSQADDLGLQAAAAAQAATQLGPGRPNHRDPGRQLDSERPGLRLARAAPPWPGRWPQPQPEWPSSASELFHWHTDGNCGTARPLRGGPGGPGPSGPV